MDFKTRVAGVTQNHLLIGAGLLFLIVHTILWMLQNPFPGHDQCALLFDARRMLSGNEIYGPFVSETNPPLIVWFSAISVFLSQLLHLKETTMLYVVLSSLICLSILWSIHIARRQGWSQTSLLLLACALVLFEAPGSILIFAQREDLLLICILPCILALALDASLTNGRNFGFPERCALGIAAGLGVCFKPQQLLLLIAIELIVIVLSRSFRHLLSAELLFATGTCALYVGAIALFAPLYFRQTLPILLDVYWALGAHSAGSLALRQYPEMLLLTATIAVAFFFFKSESDRRPVLIFGACSLAASIAFDIQHTGWGYQRYPAVVFTLLAATFVVIPMISLGLDRLDRSAAGMTVAFVMLLAVFLTAFEWKTWRQQELPNDAGTFTGLHKGDTVYVLSTDVTFFYLAYAREMNWGSRYVHLWMLPAILENQHNDRPPGAPFKALSPQKLAALSTLQRTDLAADLDHWQPKVVLVEDCPCPFINQKVDLLNWFSADPSFRAAWSHYDKVRDVSVFRVYQRAR